MFVYKKREVNFIFPFRMRGSINSILQLKT